MPKSSEKWAPWRVKTRRGIVDAVTLAADRRGTILKVRPEIRQQLREKRNRNDQIFAAVQHYRVTESLSSTRVSRS